MVHKSKLRVGYKKNLVGAPQVTKLVPSSSSKRGIKIWSRKKTKSHGNPLILSLPTVLVVTDQI